MRLRRRVRIRQIGIILPVGIVLVRRRSAPHAPHLPVGVLVRWVGARRRRRHPDLTTVRTVRHATPELHVVPKLVALAEADRVDAFRGRCLVGARVESLDVGLIELVGYLYAWRGVVGWGEVGWGRVRKRW